MVNSDYIENLTVASIVVILMLAGFGALSLLGSIVTSVEKVQAAQVEVVKLERGR